MTVLTRRAASDLHFKDPRALAEGQELVRQVARAHAPSVFCTLGMGSLRFIPEEYWPCTVVDSVDAVSRLLDRRLSDDATLSAWQRCRLRLIRGPLRRFESEVMRKVGAVAYNSTVDIAYMRQRYPQAPLVHVPDGCDIDYFSPDHCPDIEETDNEIVFIGHMRYPPNADAAQHLAEDIMPLIWKQRRDVRAVIIGPEPPERLRRSHDGERINVTGFVDDVRPYVKRAALVVSPLRFGAGMKNKFQAGLAMGKGMVVSTDTCEGFDDLEPGRHMFVADDPQDFADKVVLLLNDQQRRRQMGAEGQKRIRERYSWQSGSDNLWAALKACPIA